MASGTLGPSLKPLRDLFGGGTTVGLGDEELLRRFAATRDGTAFEAIVSRHGPMVAATCRAILRDHHDVEDAFQATFLVLARKAGSVREGDALGGWLHRVACRAAVQMNLEARRRRRQESENAAMAIPDPSRPPLDFDVRGIVHEEIDRLGEAERLPVVLCDLEGLTYEQAAGRLRCTVPTLYHRLARGRKRLRSRLIRRGVTAGVIGSAMESARSTAAAAVPASWTQSAVATATGAAVPVAVSALSHSIIRSLLMNRLRSMALLITMALGSLVSAGIALGGAIGKEPPPPAPRTPPPAPVVEPAPAAEADPKPGQVTVEVRDRATGSPMPDVPLELRVWTSTKTVTTARTDASGTSRFPLPADIRDLYVIAEREGMVRQSHSWSRRREGGPVPDRLVFLMEPGTTIRGCVVDADRKPVAGATVVEETWKTDPRTGQQAVRIMDYTRTDADGRWSFSRVPSEPDSIKLAVYDYRHLREWPLNECFQLEDFKPLSALRDGSATLRLPGPGTTIEGTVLAPDGRPVAGAEIVIGSGRRFGNSIPPLKSDERGRFVLGMTPGTATTLLVDADGFGPALQSIRVGREAQHLTIRLQPAHRVSGRVVDAGGKPVPRAEVWITSWRGAEGLAQLIRSDAEGRFAWNEAPGDEIQVRASAPGFASTEGITLMPGKPREIVLTRPYTVKGTVVDARTGQPIPRFTIAIGTVSRAASPLIWQRSSYLDDKDAKKAPGSFEYLLYGRDHQYNFRIFSDGYYPADSGRFPGDGSQTTLTFRLERGEPIRGLVRNPDGSPAAGSTVSLVPAEQEGTIDYLDLRNGEVSEHSRLPAEQAKAGPDGRFSLPPQRGQFALVVLSDSGYAIVHRRDLPGDHTIRLHPWARISGTVRIDGKPAADLFLLTTDEPGMYQVFGEPRIDSRYQTRTDAQGRFALDRVMAGRLTLCEWVPNGLDRRFFHVPAATLDVESGRSYALRIGESGRRLTGRLVLPTTGRWMIRKAAIEAKNATGPTPNFGVAIVEDGRLRAQDLPPGDYTMEIALHEPPPENSCGWGRLIAAYSRDFSVSGQAQDPPLDLGSIAPLDQAGPVLLAGDAAPEFSVRTLDGKVLSLSSMRGRYVLLDFWATWCAPCIEEIPNLEAIQKSLANDPRLAIVSLSLNETTIEMESFVKARKLDWPQAQVGPDSPVVAAYGATAIPATFLIGPDGKIIAAGLRGAKLKAAIEEHLRPGRR